MKPYKFKSLYAKWIFLFTGLILVAQGFTLLFALQYILPDLQNNLSEKIYRKALFIQDLYQRDQPLTDDLLQLTGDTDIYFYLFEMDAMPDEISVRYRNLISLDMLVRASNGEIVLSYLADSAIKKPFCLLALGNKLALLTPNILKNDITFFITAYQRSLIASSVCASTLIVLALIVVIKPIKKVSQATREVADGNFNLQLETKSLDEVGQLIHNFNKMTQALQKNEYLRKEFVSNVSHEFKTPITSIAGFAKLMKNENIRREELNEYADIIIREAERLSNLSSNLLQLSLLDNDSFKPVQNIFSLDEQIREAILLLQNKWEEKHINFDIQMDEISFSGPETLLSQVWINLIDNAIKFSPVNGVILISLHSDSDGITASVTDQGTGVPVELRERVFERFYKADKSRAKEGSGLGLSIVKHVLKLVNGTVSVSKAEKAGACFTVSLPASHALRP